MSRYRGCRAADRAGGDLWPVGPVGALRKVAQRFFIEGRSGGRQRWYAGSCDFASGAGKHGAVDEVPEADGMPEDGSCDKTEGNVAETGTR